MAEWSHRRVVIATALLSIGSLSFVFLASSRVAPDVVPVAPAWVFESIPHLNAGIALVALAAMGLGYLAIRERDIRRHRRWMLLALGAFGTFLALYLYNVWITGPHPFPGPETIYLYVYLPILLIHIILAVVCIPLLYYVSILALTRSPAEIPQTRHPTIARPTLVLWAISFFLGLTIYVQLYLIY